MKTDVHGRSSVLQTLGHGQALWQWLVMGCTGDFLWKTTSLGGQNNLLSEGMPLPMFDRPFCTGSLVTILLYLLGVHPVLGRRGWSLIRYSGRWRVRRSLVFTSPTPVNPFEIRITPNESRLDQGGSGIYRVLCAPAPNIYLQHCRSHELGMHWIDRSFFRPSQSAIIPSSTSQSKSHPDTPLRVVVRVHVCL